MRHVALAPPDAVHEETALERQHGHGRERKQRVGEERARRLRGRAHGGAADDVVACACALLLRGGDPRRVGPLQNEGPATILFAHPALAALGAQRRESQHLPTLPVAAGDPEPPAALRRVGQVLPAHGARRRCLKAIGALEVDERVSWLTRELETLVLGRVCEDVGPRQTERVDQRMFRLALPRAVEAVLLCQPLGVVGLGMTGLAVCAIVAHAWPQLAWRTPRRRTELALARARVELEAGIARKHTLCVLLGDPALARAQRAALGTRVVGGRVAAREPPPAGTTRARQTRGVARVVPRSHELSCHTRRTRMRLARLTRRQAEVPVLAT
jgi:hypothetical protein